MLRLSTPGYTRFIQTDRFDAVYGGGEANVAVSCANYGHEAYFVTKLPQHEIGQAAVDALRKYGVKTDYIIRGGERIGIYYLESGDSVRPSKVIYDRSHSSIAEAASDTWAGEIGQLSSKDPLSIATFTKVPKGISGGVTVLGLLASLAASLSVALLFWGTFGTDLWGLLLIAASGFLGALFDSLLGATLQVQYRRKDGSLTEDPKEGERARGVPFMDNDAVNLLSGLFAFSVAVALYSL